MTEVSTRTVNAAEAVGDALDKFLDIGSWRPAGQDALHDAIVDALTPYVLPHEPTEMALRTEVERLRAQISRALTFINRPIPEERDRTGGSPEYWRGALDVHEDMSGHLRAIPTTA